jgi:hypothetical protein
MALSFKILLTISAVLSIYILYLIDNKKSIPAWLDTLLVLIARFGLPSAMVIAVFVIWMSQ